MEPTLWERVDERVLRWVATLPPSLEQEILELPLREPEPFAAVPDLDTNQVNESLRRLVSHKLIEAHESGTFTSALWYRLRVTAQGWIVLDEWPDLDRVATAAALNGILRALAHEAPDAEREPLMRSAGVLSRTADDVIRGTATEVAAAIGREAVDGE